MKYIVVKASSIDILCEKVEAKINEGWLPQGGVAVANSSTLIFIQAMIFKS